MSGARTAGGILSITGGALFLAGALFTPTAYLLGVSILLEFIVALLIGGLALVGGIVGLKSSKKAGGGIALATGITACALGVLHYVTPLIVFHITSYALLEFYIPFDHLFFGLTIEGILILIGGILLLASSDL